MGQFYVGGDSNRRGAHIFGRVVHLLAVQEGEGIDLFHDVADVYRGRGRTTRLHLVAEGAQIIGGDFVELPVLKGWQDVPIDNALAHRLGAVSHPGAGQPFLGHFAKGLGGSQPALLALLLQRGGLTQGDGLLGVDQLFARQGQRNAGWPIAADGQRLAASVETVIVAEGDGTDGRYRHVHSVAVKSLVSLGLRLEIAQCSVGEHRGFPPVRDGFYRQGPGDLLMLGKPHKTSFPEKTFTVKDGFGLNSEREGLNPASDSYRQFHRQLVPLAGDSHR